MRSTKYDKKGSVVGDLVKPLESLLYQSIRHLEGRPDASVTLEAFAETRRIVSEMSELIVRAALLTDSQIWPQPCYYFRLDERAFRQRHFGYMFHLRPMGGFFVLGPYRCEWNKVDHLCPWMDILERRVSVRQAFDIIRREHGLQ